MLLIIVLFLYLITLLTKRLYLQKWIVRRKMAHPSLEIKSDGYPRNQKKPDWVVDKVIYLKALMPKSGCGTIAMTFNRIYSDKGETVSKTYVYEKLKTCQYQVKCKRRELKARQPKASSINQTWGMDLTSININGKQQLILGIIDHGSRALLSLHQLKSKHSLIIIREVIQAMKRYGFPKMIRSDNEICFTAKLIRLSLKLLSIKQQTTDVACPWQNGRIERCFLTFKQKWRLANLTKIGNLQAELNIYQIWYNVIRPHSNLGGRTPAEIYLNKIPRGQPILTAAWSGILTGYYFPD